VPYSVSGRCYATEADAASAAFSRVVSSFDSSGALHSVEFVSTGWVLRSYDSGVLVSESAAPSLGFTECDVVSGVDDAWVLAWGVVAAWVLAWAVVQIRRALV